MIVLWGSNARETHPIFFHHVLAARRNGRPDLRRRSPPHRPPPPGPSAGSASTSAPTSPSPTPSAARSSRRPRQPTLRRTGHDRLRRVRAPSVEPWTLERAEEVTGVAADDIAPSPTPTPGRPCPALLDARHHRAPQRRRQRGVADQPGAAHRPRRAGRERPQPAAGAEQRAGRRRHGRGAQPAAWLPGHPRRRGPAPRSTRRGVRRSRRATASTSPPCSRRWSTASCGPCTSRREPGPVGGRHHSGPALLRGLDHLVVQDIFLTRTAELADVVLPATASWCESEGTVTNSERRVQRVRKAVDGPRTAPATTSTSCWPRRPARPRVVATAGPTPRRRPRRGGVGRGALALADAPRHDATPASKPSAASSGRASPRTRLEPPVPARPAVGRRPGRAGRAGAVQRRRP